MAFTCCLWSKLFQANERCHLPTLHTFHDTFSITSPLGKKNGIFLDKGGHFHDQISTLSPYMWESLNQLTVCDAYVSHLLTSWYCIWQIHTSCTICTELCYILQYIQSTIHHWTIIHCAHKTFWPYCLFVNERKDILVLKLRSSSSELIESRSILEHAVLFAIDINKDNGGYFLSNYNIAMAHSVAKQQDCQSNKLHSPYLI